jgi:hypothetical protein
MALLRWWKDGLKVGDCVDAADSDRRWYEAVIVDREDDLVTVSWPAWDAKWDTKIHLDSPYILPRYSIVTPWVSKLRPNDHVEISSRHRRWFRAKVVCTCTFGDTIAITAAWEEAEPYAATFLVSNTTRSRWKIAQLGTHLLSFLNPQRADLASLALKEKRYKDLLELANFAGLPQFSTKHMWALRCKLDIVQAGGPLKTCGEHSLREAVMWHMWVDASLDMFLELMEYYE